MSIASPLKWHGGKGAFGGKLASWIISKMPPRSEYCHYVEPFAGGLSVLLAHDPEGISEVVNDLNGELTNFWKCLQDGVGFALMKRILEATPFSEHEWQESGEPSQLDAAAYRAVKFFIRCRQSLAGRMDSFAPLSKTRTRRGMNEQASAWLSAVIGLPEVHERLKRVAIVGPKPATQVIQQQDGEKTLFYCDPPYLHETRASTGEYAHEMSAVEHLELLEFLGAIEGKFLLSGYRSDLYDDKAAQYGWTRHDFTIPNNAAAGKTKREMTECLWVNF